MTPSAPDVSVPTVSPASGPPSGTTPARCARTRWLAAMAAAAVPSALLLFLSEGSRGWPGLIFDEPGRGLCALPALVFNGPDWLLHAAIFAIFTLAFVLLHAAAAFDRDGLAADSLRWACRPRGIRLLMLLALACLLAAFLPRPTQRRRWSAWSRCRRCCCWLSPPFSVVTSPPCCSQPSRAGGAPGGPEVAVLLLILPLSLLAGPMAD